MCQRFEHQHTGFWGAPTVLWWVAVSTRFLAAMEHTIQNTGGNHDVGLYPSVWWSVWVRTGSPALSATRVGQSTQIGVWGCIRPKRTRFHASKEHCMRRQVYEMQWTWCSCDLGSVWVRTGPNSPHGFKPLMHRPYERRRRRR